MKVNEVAAAIHKKMVNDDRFGYSWEERWGNKAETWTIGGKKYSIKVGDYDCSSSCITAWKAALSGTSYAGKLDGATVTQNMRSVFVGSGLFQWKPISFIASPGDLYLSEENHVAMCQTQEPDVLSEFSWGDNGAYGNKRGDQSGWEARENPYYDYPWDGILHYNGKADSASGTTTVVTQPRYRVYSNGKWSAWKSNASSCGSKGKPIYDVEFSGLPAKSWFRLTLKGGKVLDKNKQNVSRKLPVIGIEVFYNTANPSKTGYYEAMYRVHVSGGMWLKWEHDNDDGGAGDDENAIDVIQFKVVKAK